MWIDLTHFKNKRIQREKEYNLKSVECYRIILQPKNFNKIKKNINRNSTQIKLII